MKGFGTDEDAIIDIVARRSNAQRQEIRQSFKSLLGRDLMKDLKSELSKNLERLIIGLMLTPAEFDAKMMKKAMENWPAPPTPPPLLSISDKEVNRPFKR
ncbi:Annexin A6 [Ilyodon furcidens]|uniref:Annexin n=1 Tax=Ilyodon furcidens TaxID=33524 RepID=A0ABV0UYT8_9TELE